MGRTDDAIIPADTPWLHDTGALGVCRILSDAGYEALFVGGCVRNAILGTEVSDIDIATDAVPETVMKLADDAGLRAVPTGIEHGTVTVVADGHGYEVTTFRRDVSTDGRRADVVFSTDIREDALRRDFTMNALYARPDGALVDPLGGLEDTLARRIRFIEDAETRIREDYLRILRFFRFSAWYGDPSAGFDPDALAAIAKTVSGLDRLSPERVGAEMLRLLSAPDPAPAVAVMQSAGVLSHVLSGADSRYLPVLIHLETEFGLSPDPLLRLACLNPANASEALRLSRKDDRHLRQLRDAVAMDVSPRVLGYRFGVETARGALLLRAASTGCAPSAEALSEIAAGARAQFPVRAADLQPQFSGKALGDRLRYLEDKWLGSGQTLTRDELLD